MAVVKGLRIPEDEMTALHETAEELAGGPRSTHIKGPGGFGKSAIFRDSVSRHCRRAT
jgi:hypothetical protein